jgi:hypothetical protein
VATKRFELGGASYAGMKVLLPIVLFIAASPLFAGTSGSFAGTVVDGPDSSGQWVYVQGHNQSIRRVNISQAKIRYDDDVPKSERKSPLPRALPAGTRVRVTAEQDEAGEWRANVVEILEKTAADPDEKKDASATTSQT